MHHSTGKKLFAVVFVLLLVGAIYLVNGLRFDMVTLSSVPVILGAETIVLGMLYATIFHGEEHDHGLPPDSAHH